MTHTQRSRVRGHQREDDRRRDRVIVAIAMLLEYGIRMRDGRCVCSRHRLYMFIVYVHKIDLQIVYAIREQSAQKSATGIVVIEGSSIDSHTHVCACVYVFIAEEDGHDQKYSVPKTAVSNSFFAAGRGFSMLAFTMSGSWSVESVERVIRSSRG